VDYKDSKSWSRRVVKSQELNTQNDLAEELAGFQTAVGFGGIFKIQNSVNIRGDGAGSNQFQ